MSLKILSHITSFNIDMQKNQLQNAVVHPLASAPSSPTAGQIYYNTSSLDLFFWNGSAWVSSAGVTSVTAGNGISITGTNTVTVTNATVGYASTAKSASTVTLTATSASRQVFTGSVSQALTLPAITTLYVGWSVAIINDASQGNINVSAAGPIAIGPVAGGQIVRFVCTATTGAENEGWNVLYEGSYSATGSNMLVYSDSPTLVSPDLGTPSAVNLSNGTSLPIISGTTGNLTVARGGTGVTSFTANGILYGNGGNALQVTGAGSQHQVLLAGSGGTPAFGALNLAQAAAVTGILPIGNGGTGSNTGSITGSGALTFTAGGSNTNITLAPNGTGTVNVSSKRITNLAEPTQATDAATKGYVDGMAQGLDLKASVLCASTTNIAGNYDNGTNNGVGATLTPSATGPFSLDGVSANTIGVRVLIKDQSTPAQNGIYVVTQAGASGVSPILTRATDFDQPAEIPGAFTFVEQGTTQADRGYVCTTDAAGLVIGTTNITFTQFSSAGSYTASNGITLSGTDFQLASGNVLSLFNINADGFVARNGSGTVVVRTLTGTANQISITNTTGGGNPVFSLPQNIHTGATPTFSGITINGNVTIRAAASASAATHIPIFTADPSSTARNIVTRTPAQLRGDIAAMPEPAGNGIVVRTGSQTSANRTITAGNGVSVSNGDGVSANPTIALKSFSGTGPSSTANTWTVNHGLDSENLIVTLREAGAGKELVLAETVFTNNNSLVFNFASNQNINTLRVSILRVD